jgi:hypothetical protein
VLFKFNDQTTREQKDSVIAGFRALRNKISGIVDLQCDYNFNERSNQGFEIGLTVRLENKEALSAYGPHEEHRKVASYMREVGLREHIVVDFEL